MHSRPLFLTAYRVVVLFIASLWLYSAPASGQCLPTAPPDVTCMSGTNVSNNSNVNNGNTFVHCSGSGTFNSINLNGGTLQVCGVATMANFNFNSGVLHIAQYAQLTISGNVTLNNNCTIINYGTLIINGNLQFQNNNNYVYNARTDARLAVSGTISFPSNVGQNAYLVNKGYLTAGTVTLSDGIVAFCLENGSYMGVNNFNLSLNNINNPITYGSLTGSAVIRYSASANLGGNASKAVTPSSSITVCRATGAAFSGSGNWGSATLTAGCAVTEAPTQTGVVTTCYTLPVEWLSFDAEQTSAGVELSWSTASETNNDFFEVQRAGADGEYVTIAQLDGAGNSSQINRYAYTLENPETGDNYFRIKQVDFNGAFDFSNPVYVQVTAANEVQYTMNTLVTEEITVQVNTRGAMLSLTLYNEMGQPVLQAWLQEGNNSISTGQLAAGTYIAVLCNAQGEIVDRNLVLKTH